MLVAKVGRDAQQVGRIRVYILYRRLGMKLPLGMVEKHIQNLNQNRNRFNSLVTLLPLNESVLRLRCSFIYLID